MPPDVKCALAPTQPQQALSRHELAHKAARPLLYRLWHERRGDHRPCIWPTDGQARFRAQTPRAFNSRAQQCIKHASLARTKL